jgi:RNA polymerase sigma-70 factor (ECF subfamily)
MRDALLPLVINPAEEALVEAINLSSRRLWGVAFRLLRSTEDAEEVLQEAALRAWAGRHCLNEPAAAAAWLKTIVLRECLRKLRWRSIRSWIPLLEVMEPRSQEPLPDQQLGDQQRWLELQQAIQALPPRQRLAFGLRFEEGWTIPEIAAAMEVSQETVKTQLQQAALKIQARVKP